MRALLYKLKIAYCTILYCVLALSLAANYGVYTGKLARANGMDIAEACNSHIVASVYQADESAVDNAAIAATPVKLARASTGAAKKARKHG